MNVEYDDREIVITATEAFFEKYLKIMKEDIDKIFKDKNNKIKKKLDFPIVSKIYNKLLASDIASVSELFKNSSNKESLFTFVKDKSKYTDYHTPTDEEINLIKTKFPNAAFIKGSACYKAYRQDGRLMVNDGGILCGVIYEIREDDNDVIIVGRK